MRRPIESPRTNESETVHRILREGLTSFSEIAREHGISVASVSRWFTKGLLRNSADPASGRVRLQVVRVGRRVATSRSAVERLLAKLTRASEERAERHAATGSRHGKVRRRPQRQPTRRSRSLARKSRDVAKAKAELSAQGMIVDDSTKEGGTCNG